MRVLLRLFLPAAVLLTLLVPIGAGAAVGAPALGFTPSSWNAGLIAPGAHVSQTLVLKNTGGAATSVLTLTISGSGAGAFKIGPDGCTALSLGPSKSCPVTVTYAPTVHGTSTATLTATSKKPGASVSANLTGIADRAPTASNDSYVTDQNTAATGNVLNNDSDPDDDPLTVTQVNGMALNVGALLTLASGALLTVNADGSFTYTPNHAFDSLPQGATAHDSFTYTASDGTLQSNPATASFTINGLNDAPVATSHSYTTNEETLLTINAPGVLANDTDVDTGDHVVGAVLTTGPTHGTLALNADGSFTYTPSPLYFGPDSFTYQAKDTYGALSSPAVVPITVNFVDHPPVANNDTYTMNENETLRTPAPGVLANDTDLDVGDQLAIPGAVWVDPPNHGDLGMGADGSFFYTPAQGFVGTDSFTYRAIDSHGATSNLATVTITVNQFNHNPTCSLTVLGVSKNERDTITFHDLLGRCTDQDGDTMTLSNFGSPSNGTLTVDQTGQTVTYSPNQDFVGDDSFTVDVGDGHGGSTTFTVHLDVG